MVDSATAPVLSFPAILRNPGLKDLYAHLHEGPARTQESSASAQVRVRKDQNVGKRWVRRKDNAHFVGNPHVVSATKKDYALPFPSNKPTFPEPLPSYLPRTAKVPAGTLPTRDPVSANAGRFSLSIKGMRKELRRAGGRAEALVRDVEAEMLEWLQGGVILRPDESNATGLANLQRLGVGRQIGSTGSIREVSRTPLQLVWSIPDEAFVRFVVHCCARYHEIVSFSKGDSSERLTYLLRPNVQKPDYGAITTLATPPATDADYSSQIETSDVDSDFVSDLDPLDSDLEEPPSNSRPLATFPGGTLDSIQEDLIPPSPTPSFHDSKDDDEWTALSGDLDDFGDESNSEGKSEGAQELIDSVASLSLQDSPIQEPLPGQEHESQQQQDPDKTLTQDAVQELLAENLGRIPHRQQPSHLSGRRWIRNTSSPSRSPARPRRFATRKDRQASSNIRMAAWRSNKSFYDYLFT